MKLKYVAAAGASVLLMAGCGSQEAAQSMAQEAAPAAEVELPAVITLQTAGITPEGVEYDTKNGRFLVGSFTHGTVFAVATDGALSPFAEDPELKSSVGIEVDEERNRLLVANADPSAFRGPSGGGGIAKLGIYDLDSGERLAMIDLAAAGPADAKMRFANDIAVGSDGSAYVTDTMARVVYRVAPDNTVSLLVPENIAADHPLTFNGIEFHPSGYLLVADLRGGDLYKVSPDEPNTFTLVELEEKVPGADGIVLHPNGTLYVVRNDDSRSVVALVSDDEWASATVSAKATYEVQATTAALVGDDVYVVHPHFGDDQALSTIERVTFE
ncbi:MAG: hypothetical protein DIU71_07865 [Proteobacteria bacterium]|nr:MAG: hypothetical protein DIU71_07865 [Pseudomonadota bacterium]